MIKILNFIGSLFFSTAKVISRFGYSREPINQMVSIKYDINRKIN